MKKTLASAGLAALALSTMAAKCGTNTTPVANTPSSAGGGASASSKPAPAVAHVGAAIALTGQNDSKGNITLVKVIDPAQGSDQFMTPDTGKRFVAAEFTVASTAGTIDQDVNNDASVIGSDNQTYTADVSSIAGCTNFDMGQIKVNAGDSQTGCAVFQVPTGVTVAKVRFAMDMGFAQTGEWLNP